jgi:hypothetical protein
LIGGWVGLKAGLDDMEKGKFLPLMGLKLRSLGRPVAILMRYPGSLIITMTTIAAL